MGAEGIVVDNLEDVGPALKRAIDLQMNHGKTTIIEIMCTRELGDPFRRDALAKPVRPLDKYKDYQKALEALKFQVRNEPMTPDDMENRLRTELRALANRK